MLKGDAALYIFFFDLMEQGEEDVTVNNSLYAGSYSFGNVTDKIKEIVWMDTHEKIEFIQGGEMLSVNATGYPHGMSTCVRVAKALVEN